MELNNPHGAKTAYLNIVQTDDPDNFDTYLKIRELPIQASIVTRPEFGCVLHKAARVGEGETT
ncbi:hypothetical protein [Deinococcus sp. QL22]|uniref:hypothetical protein n=1 Tax=Deinococcus sp. QL22 TaxID=2939437 RepID=UPI0020173A98|nr:hypothetical protein [Deinococcus sp. QL22]UQN10317.1 hypothetical protein M1R55_29640 [Deinococcus sp. QL22]UQN10451.1 hypothetical protein M1R55_28965 [Deinococcus sp. QL22]